MMPREKRLSCGLYIRYNIVKGVEEMLPAAKPAGSVFWINFTNIYGRKI